MRFWREKKGVSVVLGTLLMFIIMVTLYTSIQVTQLPIWNNQIDVQAYETTYGDMLFLKSDVKNVALLKQPKSAIIRMGARYPDRMIFINPKQGIYGSMTTENATVTVNYTYELAGQNVTATENYTSSRLIYESMGAERTKIIYEHGLIIRAFPAGSVSTDTQELIVGDELYVPLLNTSLFSPMSSMRPESFSLKPFTGFKTRVDVTSVTVTLPVAYPQVWADRLEGIGTNRTTFTINQTTKQLIITSNATRRITFPLNTATDAPLSAGVIYFSSTTEAGFDPTTNFPHIHSISYQAVGSGVYKKTHTTITAIVKNVTAPFDIHADLTDLTGNVLDFDVAPTYSSNTSLPIDAANWDVPNEVTVKWEDITHPEFQAGEPVAVTFWVYNSVLDQRYSMTSITVRLSGDNWR